MKIDPDTLAMLTEMTNQEMVLSDRALDALLQDWHAFRDHIAATHPDYPAGAALAMFCVRIHDAPGSNSQLLAGLLSTALWRIDRLLTR